MLLQWSRPPPAPDTAAAWREKLLLAVFVIVLFLGGYTLVAALTDPARVRELRTPLDDAIPFWKPAIHPYSLVYTAAFYPMFCVRDPALFRRVARGYAAVIALSLLTFLAVPVSSRAFRGDPASLDPALFAEWGMRLTYAVDPPYNLFPSIHLGVATMAVLSAWTARRLWGLVALPGALAVAAGILLVKQHFVADGVAAVLLAFVAWALLVRPHPPAAAPDPTAHAHGWRGPVAWLALHAGFYAGMYAMFLAGWRPWKT